MAAFLSDRGKIDSYLFSHNKNADKQIAESEVMLLETLFSSDGPCTVGYAEKEGDNYGGDAYDSDNQVDLKGTISWELDLWGKLRWSRDASLADFLGSIENRRALQMSLIARVAQSYFELVAEVRQGDRASDRGCPSREPAPGPHPLRGRSDVGGGFPPGTGGIGAYLYAGS